MKHKPINQCLDRAACPEEWVAAWVDQQQHSVLFLPRQGLQTRHLPENPQIGLPVGMGPTVNPKPKNRMNAAKKWEKKPLVKTK
jgi:hypothetical protein